MGGFAGVMMGLGGAGEAAQQYGAQIRPILERQREAFGIAVGKMADEELNPDYRRQLRDIQLQAESGGPMHKIVPALQKVQQLRQADHQLLGQAAQSIQPKPPVPPPGPGQQGTATAKPAAQVSTSPVQPVEQTSTAIAGSTPFKADLTVPPIQPAAQPTAQAAAPKQPTDFLPPVVGGVKASDLVQTPQGRTLLQPFITNEAERQRLQATFEMTQENTKRVIAGRIQALKDSGDWDKLSPRQRAELQIGATQITPELRPIQIPGLIDTPAGATDLTGNPITTSQSRVMRNPDGTLSYFPVTGPTSTETVSTPGGGFGRQRFDRFGREVGGPEANAVPGPVVGAAVAPHQVTDTRGGIHFLPAPEINKGDFINPEFAPRTTSSVRSVQTTDAQGNPVTELVPITSTTTRGVAPSRSAATASPGQVPPVQAPGGGAAGARQFPRPFTPAQALKNDQQLGQYNLAIDRMQKIRGQTHLLDSMIESGKLQLETDSGGLVRAIVNRMLPMTQAEAEFVGNFRTMMEDINLLRGPMGATGFRGPEAWAALQGQRGQLLANPMITRQVLDNSITALKAQAKPLQDRSGGRVQPITPQTPNVQNWGRDAKGNPVRIQ